MPLADVALAANMRDVITMIVRQVLDDVRPTATYATVMGWSRAKQTVDVAMGGQLPIVTLPCRTIQPNQFNSLVRIEGDNGDRYVSEVVDTGGATVVCREVRAGIGTAGFLADSSAAPIHTHGSGGGYSFDSRTTPAVGRWYMYAPNDTYMTFANGGNEKIRIDAPDGRVAIGYDRAGFSNWGGQTSTLQVGSRENTNLPIWPRATILLVNDAAAAANPVCHIAMWNVLANQAPVMYAMGAAGESFSFVNSANTTYIPLLASAFTIGSSRRWKDDVEDLLPSHFGRTSFSDIMRAVPARKWVKSTIARTSNIDPEDREKSIPHVCGAGYCTGTPDDKCPAGMNDDQPQFGFVAEELAELLPAMVNVDYEKRPTFIDLTKLIGVLWAATRELVGEVDALKARLEAAP